ncbi:hypothetical protein GCM10027598_46920 [Amycolatopsis oliviviridis]|uniref:Mersacidin/lichenicidin family type 2 lantibiotic n=1 Tax=Amycolatopsis oliviviridis TaxID=1471590 RepID=A0ABQ3MBN7_9PSEU|nr:mersacidin/lichenicidin family type 2 lantibiotic [Amycolatopsis oliviviridis]GHH38572.1 hypothetical protein GCM10017790_84550 [Amycolatopsis oliviviridis]
MNHVKAWKDPDFRRTISGSDTSLHDNPAGAAEVSFAELGNVAGGTSTIPCVTLPITVSAAVCVPTKNFGSIGCC